MSDENIDNKMGTEEENAQVDTEDDTVMDDGEAKDEANDPNLEAASQFLGESETTYDSDTDETDEEASDSGDEQDDSNTGDDNIPPDTENNEADDDPSQAKDTGEPVGDDNPTDQQDTEEQDDFDLDAMLDSELIDEELIDTLKPVFEKMNSKLDRLNRENSELRNELQQHSRRAATQAFDEAVNRLDGFEDVLGKGKGSELQRDSKQFQNRVKLINQMRVLSSGYKSTGQPVPSEGELMGMAVKSLFGEPSKPSAKAERPNLSRPSKTARRPKSAQQANLEAAEQFIG